jgi:methyltransferase family protein
MTPSDLLATLHQVSPYAGHDVAAHPGDMQGWGSTDPAFRRVIELLRPEVIIEVGSWKGASAIHMAGIVKALGLASSIVCVDTWLGSPEHFLGVQPEWRQSLRLRNGYPQLYFTFLTNVIEHGASDTIIPLPATSENAAAILRHKQVRPDLVYIDGAHEYGAVRRDLQLYWQLLSDRGVLLGDDYMHWPSVTQAANDFAKEHGLMMLGRPGKFILSKDATFLPKLAAPVPQGGDSA